MGDSSGISGLCKKKKVNFQSDLNDNKVHFQMALLQHCLLELLRSEENWRVSSFEVLKEGQHAWLADQGEKHYMN